MPNCGPIGLQIWPPGGISQKRTSAISEVTIFVFCWVLQTAETIVQGLNLPNLSPRLEKNALVKNAVQQSINHHC
jgi:hypothetical protein